MREGQLRAPIAVAASTGSRRGPARFHPRRCARAAEGSSRYWYPVRIAWADLRALVFLTSAASGDPCLSVDQGILKRKNKRKNWQLQMRSIASEAAFEGSWRRIPAPSRP